MTKITIDVDTLAPDALLGLARQEFITLRDAAKIVLSKAGFTDEEVAVVTMPGAKHRLVNGHRKPTVDDQDFALLWEDSSLRMADLTKATGQSDETMRRRAKNQGLGPRARGRKTSAR